MRATKKKHYTARWAQAGHPSTASVSFQATSDYHARLQADKIGRQLGVSKTPRVIMCDGRIVS